MSCAKNLPPPGGPPDTTPPELVGTSPASGTTGVALDQQIEIDFSERINQNTVGQALFISPPLKGSPRIESKGDHLVIKPDQPLDSGRTYVVSIAASLQDLHANRLPNSISFAFSTGAKIDSSRIKGTVYRDHTPLPNFRVFAYEYSDTLMDSIFATIPTYVTETGDSGDFALDFMSPEKYLVLGAADKDRDNLINRAGEQIAIPVSFDSAAPSGASMSLNVTSFDSTSLKLINCSGVEGAVKLRFDSALDSIDAREAVLTVKGSDTSFVLPAVWLAASPSELNAFSDWFTVGGNFQVSLPRLKGQTGRIYPSDSISCDVRITEKDQRAPAVVGYYPSARTLVMPSETLSVIFSEPVTAAENSIVLAVDTTESVLITPFAANETMLGFTIPQELGPDHKVKATINLKTVHDLYGNVPDDSSFSFSFQTANPESLGALAGTIEGADSNLVVELVGQINHFHYRKANVSDTTFSWPLYPDIYRITGYRDLNRDGRWNLGSLRPFRFAEPGWISADSVRIRARFEHEGRVLQFE
jgi:methionine-rich copper-binding protein CopC